MDIKTQSDDRAKIPDWIFDFFKENPSFGRQVAHWVVGLFDRYVSKTGDTYRSTDTYLIVCGCITITCETYEEFVNVNAEVMKYIAENNINVSFDLDALNKIVYDIITKMNFELIYLNAYTLFLNHRNKIMDSNLSTMIEYIIYCSLYDSQSILFDPILLLNAAIYLGIKWEKHTFLPELFVDPVVAKAPRELPLVDPVVADKSAPSELPLVDQNEINDEIISCANYLWEIISRMENLPKSFSNEKDLGIIHSLKISGPTLPKVLVENHSNIITSSTCIGTDYVKKSFISEGTYGRVYKGHHSSNQAEIIAIKEQKFNPSSVKEIAILKCLANDNIIKCLDINLSSDFKIVDLIMPHYNYDLYYVIRNLQLSENQIRLYTTQLLTAVEHCHKNNICHQDIKSGNIMVSNDLTQIILIDFGFSRYHAVPEIKFLGKMCCVHYRPPEIIMKCPTYTDKVDMWGIGCIIGEMIEKRMLFAFMTNDQSKSYSVLLDIFKRRGVSGAVGNKFPSAYHSCIETFSKIGPKRISYSNIQDKSLENVLNGLLEICPDARLDAVSALKMLE